MAKTLVGIIVTTLALFLWGYLYWGISPMPYNSLVQNADDAAVQEILRDAFPESGTYLVPGTVHGPDELEALFQAGPQSSFCVW